MIDHEYYNQKRIYVSLVRLTMIPSLNPMEHYGHEEGEFRKNNRVRTFIIICQMKI